MKTFCCCLPSRIGVLLLSPITCATSTACSVIVFYALAQYHSEIALGQRIFLGLLGAAMSIFALSSVFGFFGALLKSFAAVSFYSTSLTSMWLSIVATGILNFVFMYKDKDEFIEQCASRNEDDDNFGVTFGFLDQEKWCDKTFVLGFALMVTFWALVALISLYLISIVRRYCKQLAEERVTTTPRPVYQV